MKLCFTGLLDVGNRSVSGGVASGATLTFAALSSLIPVRIQPWRYAIENWSSSGVPRGPSGFGLCVPVDVARSLPST